MKTNKRKQLIAPGVMIAIALCLTLVAAAVIYVGSTYNFTKTIDVTINHSGGGGGSPSDVYTNVTLIGDISNSTLECTATDENCSVTTGNLTLVNSDSSDHLCNITSDNNSDVAVTYSFGANPITVPANSNITFNIMYNADATGTYPINTEIDC